MNSDLQNHLFEKYSEIFFEKDLSMMQTCMCWGIECGDGWYNIIDSLCFLIKCKLERTAEDIERYENYLSSEDLSEEARKEFSERLKDLKDMPTKVHATQVKEKYGTLRFYTDSICPEIEAMIDLAETMSSVTCEMCGSPGEINSGGWLSVRCKPCREKQG